ncbi:hypothetical protein Lal_00016492 [Lupinus albus]|uniref:Putative cysteine alpha-hairpin motif superfamily n=1 Tax=Lupinus albus TaxID=3870 RepID=A0A6A4QIU3_LUPAL|nr:putative cysteine alpha-hairpin motif superfamily [Lupinus albus]KAF1872655.1 hypothetical protein Lal_00016492 [Lupinus albus]
MGEEGVPKTVCAEEALNLLNCVTQSPYDQDKCINLLNSLRNCVLAKKVKKFSLAEQEQQGTKPSNQKA